MFLLAWNDIITLVITHMFLFWLGYFLHYWAALTDNRPKFRHFRNKRIYSYITTAEMERDQELMVVYEAYDGRVWIRPFKNFFETVEHDGKLVQR